MLPNLTPNRQESRLWIGNDREVGEQPLTQPRLLARQPLGDFLRVNWNLFFYCSFGAL